MPYWTRRRAGKNLVGLVLFPFVLYGLFRWFEQTQVYHPSRTLSASGADLGRAWEDVYFEAADGVRLNAWFFPSGSEITNQPMAVLLCHGNAGNISHRLLTCRSLLSHGLSVLVFDYRGYGRSSGKPSEEGTYLDAEAAYQWLRNKGFSPDRILLYGESLGGAVAAELALRQSVCGLILVSTFTSIPALGAELFPWLPARSLCSIQYNTLAKLPRLNVPVLIMHSQTDTLIGSRHADALYQAANPPKIRWELYGDHNDTMSVRPEHYEKGIRRFLATLRPEAE